MCVWIGLSTFHLKDICFSIEGKREKDRKNRLTVNNEIVKSLGIYTETLKKNATK